MKKLGFVIGTIAIAAGMGTATAQEPVYVTPASEVRDETYQTWNAPLFTGGVVVFGLSYGAAVVAASQSSNEADERMYVPLVGPWLALSDRGDCNIENEACDDQTTEKVLIVADGVFQAGGAALMIGSFLFPKTVRESAPVQAMERVKPIRVGTGGRGFALTGSF